MGTLPKNFASWLNFYDHCMGSGEMLESTELRFIDKDGKKSKITFNELKTYCFDELKERRITIDEVGELLSKCSPHLNFADYNLLKNTLYAMTKNPYKK